MSLQWKPIVVASGLVALVVGASIAVSPAQEDSGGSQPASESAASQPAKRYHRLPRYYSQVVDEEQRAEIYDLQDEYGPRIDQLEAELAALEEERDAKVAAVLTEEQREKVAELEAEARAKRPRARSSVEGASDQPSDSEPPARPRTTRPRSSRP